jgi:NADH dehydrogenase
MSITNPSESSRFEYFSGKARLEEELINSGTSYAILRPAVIFGSEDILINNIAWFLRRFPVFGVFGDGKYRLEPIYVDDLAALAVREGEDNENRVIDAVGPESFTYRELVKLIADAIGSPRPIVSIPPALGWLIGWVVGKLVRDVPITRDEIDGLMEGLLYTGSLPAGETKTVRMAERTCRCRRRKLQQRACQADGAEEGIGKTLRLR